MTFELAATRAASLVLAVAATLAGCGGGSTESAVSASADSVSNAADTTPVGSSDASVAIASQDEATAEIAATGTLGADALQTTAAKLSALVSDDTAADAGVASSTVTTSSAVNNAVATTASLTTLAGASGTAADGLVTAPSEGSAAATSAPSTSTSTSGATSGAIAVTTPATSKSARSGVGVNLAGVLSYGAEIPTVDLMKKGSPWLTQCKAGGSCTGFATGASAFDTKEEALLDLDANGWVRSMPATSSTTVKYRSVTTKVAEAGVQQAGNYTVVYDGVGTIAYSGAAKKVVSESTPGRDVVAVENTDAQPFYLSITASTPSNYLRNIRVYPPGGACSANLAAYVTSASACTGAAGHFVAFENFPAANATWHPAFLASLKGFRSLRFMDWGMTNATPVANWADRPSATSRSWNSVTGVPVEWMFDLATRVGADPWMNIPPHATDAYVKSFAQLAHAHLAAGSKLQLEYGNEMWNYGFAATKWAMAQAQTVFATQFAAPGANAGVLEMNWYAMRLAQVCKIVKTEFGADASRVQCIANTQAANAWATSQTLNCVYAKPLLGGQPCGKLIDAVAIAPYFGMYIGSAKTQPSVINWTTESDGGLGKMFQEINGANAMGQAVMAPLTAAGSNATTGALGQAISWMVASKAAADLYGLPMLAYEGGQGLVSVNGDPTVLNLEYAANRDARMGAAYQKMMTAWKAAGGETFMFFSDVGKYSKSGMWGMRESQFDETSPKWVTATHWRDHTACWWTGC